MELPPLAAALVAGLLVLSGGACAPGGEPAPDAAPGGSRMKPKFEEQKGSKDRAERRQDRGQDRGPEQTDDHGSTQPATGTPQPTPSPSNSASPAGVASTTTRTSDAAGDVSGLSAPAYVDLTRAQLTHAEGGWTLAVTAAADLPQEMEGSSTTNVFGFFDTDLDGTLDYQIGASLADNGWGTGSSGPEGSRFGSKSGVEVDVEGRTLTFSFRDALLDGAQHLQWSVGAEHGTYEQVASGTTAQDYAPDRGGITA